MTFRVATLPGDCPDCKRNIRRGEIIVLVGDRWLHATCAKVYTPDFCAFVIRCVEALVPISMSHPALDTVCELQALAWGALNPDTPNPLAGPLERVECGL